MDGCLSCFPLFYACAIPIPFVPGKLTINRNSLFEWESGTLYEEARPSDFGLYQL